MVPAYFIILFDEIPFDEFAAWLDETIGERGERWEWGRDPAHFLIARDDDAAKLCAAWSDYVDRVFQLSPTVLREALYIV